MISCIYRGTVEHHRYVPVRHGFRYRIFMMYLDIAELPALFDGYRGWSARGRAPAEFRRSDYHGDPSMPLEAAVRASVEAATGKRPDGPIRMLTHLRYFGYCFNPVSFYYLFDPDGERIETILAEITNTPWKERRGLVLSQDMNLGSGPIFKYQFKKDFHVSPFWPLSHDYDWRFQAPGETLIVHMKNRSEGNVVFNATLSLKRSAINSVNLRKILWRYPFMTLKVVAGIHWQAARLYLKKAGFHRHPLSMGNPGDRHRPGTAAPMDPVYRPAGDEYSRGNGKEVSHG